MNNKKMNTIRLINQWLLPAAVCFLSVTSVLGQSYEPPIKVDKVTITPAKAEQGDTARMNFLRSKGTRIAAEGAPVYIVKVYLSSMPAPDADGFRVFVGDKPIGEHGNFKNGVFFKVYDPSMISTMAGKELSIVRRGKSIKSNIVFPSDISDETQNKAMSRSTETQYSSITDILSQ